MLVGISYKNDYGIKFDVRKFPNLESGESWLKKETCDFRERILCDNEEEALKELMELTSEKKAVEALEDASTDTLVNGKWETEFSDSYIYKMMGGGE